jgi:hypothetical protein
VLFVLCLLRILLISRSFRAVFIGILVFYGVFSENYAIKCKNLVMVVLYNEIVENWLIIAFYESAERGRENGWKNAV